ncbi:MAG: uroporphyrinogen decarboxylase [Acetobacteraceae bacterium]
MEEGKPLLRALAGETVWPSPLWLMRQAGRYLPEYRTLRREAPDFLSFCLTPELAIEASLQPVRRFGFDAAILFSDILLLPWALGYPVSFTEGIGPVLSPLGGRADLAKLDPGRVPEMIEPVLQVIRGIRTALPPACALIGFAGGPFTLACYLVDGRGGGFDRTRRMVRDDPGFFAELIACLTQAVLGQLLAEAEAGAEVLMLFDSWAGLVSPRLFRRFVSEPTAMITAGLKARFPALPLIGFPRLAGLKLEAYGQLAGVDCVSLDSGADLLLARRLLPGSIVLEGNLDPFALLCGGQDMREEVMSIGRAVHDHAHIFNLGHGVLPATPLEHVFELIALWRGQR